MEKIIILVLFSCALVSCGGGGATSSPLPAKVEGQTEQPQIDEQVITEDVNPGTTNNQDPPSENTQPENTTPTDSTPLDNTDHSEHNAAALACSTAVARGKTLYTEKKCDSCHGTVNSNGSTTGGSNSAINPTKESFRNLALNDYIATFMGSKKESCDANCADDIANYLKNLAGTHVCPSIITAAPDVSSPISYKAIAGTEIEAPETSCELITPSPEVSLTTRQLDNLIKHTFTEITIDASQQLAELPQGNVMLTLTEFTISRLLEIADEVGEQVVNDFSSLGLGCSDSRSCAKSFITKYASRAFREHVSEQLIEKMLVDLYDPENDFNLGIRQLISGILLSADTIYRYEVGVTTNTSTVLSSYDKASKLSFLLWNSIPDDILLTAARDGVLNKEQGLKAQVDRMIADDKFVDAINTFHQQWLLPFEESNSTTVKYGQTELNYVIEYLFRNDGSLNDFFTTQLSYINDSLADIYQVSGTANDETWKTATLASRPGILSRAAFLAGSSSNSVLTSPTVRGNGIYHSMLCREIAEPPADVQELFPVLPRTEGVTTRQELEEITAIESRCDSCHGVIDPIGFTLEKFDGSGHLRLTEESVPIDTDVTDSPLGPMNGLEGLNSALVDNQEVRACYAKHWFAYVFVREHLPDNDCALQEFQARFEQTDGKLMDLIYLLVDNPALHYRDL